jgi:hypothetical protein
VLGLDVLGLDVRRLDVLGFDVGLRVLALGAVVTHVDGHEGLRAAGRRGRTWGTRDLSYPSKVPGIPRVAWFAPVRVHPAAGSALRSTTKTRSSRRGRP